MIAVLGEAMGGRSTWNKTQICGKRKSVVIINSSHRETSVTEDDLVYDFIGIVDVFS